MSDYPPSSGAHGSVGAGAARPQDPRVTLALRLLAAVERLDASAPVQLLDVDRYDRPTRGWYGHVVYADNEVEQVDDAATLADFLIGIAAKVPNP